MDNREKTPSRASLLSQKAEALLKEQQKQQTHCR